MLIVHIFGKKFAATGKDRAHILVCGLTPFPGRPSHSRAVSPFTPDPSRSFQRFARLSAAHLTATPTPQMSLDCPCFVTSFSQYFIISTFSKNPRTGSSAGTSDCRWGVAWRPARGRGLASPEGAAAEGKHGKGQAGGLGRGTSLPTHTAWQRSVLWTTPKALGVDRQALCVDARAEHISSHYWAPAC